MNSDIYIFGKLGTYYSQYPDDFTSEIFMKMGEWNTSADTYISVHRKGELMYYGYVRRLKVDCYIGFCSVLNGMMVTDFNALFEIFDSMLDHLAVGGEILKYSDSGEIVANTQSLVFGKPVLNQVRALLKDGLSGLFTNLKGLPPESYGISVSESKQFDLHVDDMSQIVSVSWNYCYTFIAKDSGMPASDSYQGVLCRLHKERKELEVTNSDLLEQVAKLKRQKKQQSMVIFLGVVAVICFFILLGVKQSLNETQRDLNRSRFILEDTQIALTDTKADLDKTKKQSEEMQSSFFSKMLEKDRQIISLRERNEQMAADLKYTESKLTQVQRENSELSIENYRMKSDNVNLNNENRTLKKEIAAYKDSQTGQINHYGNSQNIKKAILITDTYIRKEPYFNAPEVKKVERLSRVEVFYTDLTNGYYKVRYKNTVGYLFKEFLKFE